MPADLRGCGRCGPPPLRSIVASMNTTASPRLLSTAAHRHAARRRAAPSRRRPPRRRCSSARRRAAATRRPRPPAPRPIDRHLDHDSDTRPRRSTEAPPTTTVAADVPTTTVTTVARPTATIDQLVGAEGARVHVRCVGQGDTTVRADRRLRRRRHGLGQGRARHRCPGPSVLVRPARDGNERPGHLDRDLHHRRRPTFTHC